ncbi:alpha/beta fold hydrolase [Microbacterium luteum]|uniref:alpha/beta fold hydrolase n=1 Tax=Microbacterium luteum TaxID=2782167 RepID=UPI001E49FC33|nr:alpha/beta hydrolase [Microbacterium luteum]
MDILLVPGLWLDASSWSDVTAPLVANGHRVHPLTMPGTGASASESDEIGIDDWVGAVVREIDAATHPVVLIGHSGGGNVVYAAADRRPHAVAHVTLLDTFPPVPGAGISDFPSSTVSCRSPGGSSSTRTTSPISRRKRVPARGPARARFRGTCPRTPSG